MITTTPLLEFLANKQNERREERRRKNEDKKKYRDEEKSRKKDGTCESNDRKRRGGGDNNNSGGGGGKSRNKLNHGNKSASIPEEAGGNADGITVRVIKSRTHDRPNDRRTDNHRASDNSRNNGRKSHTSDETAPVQHNKDDKNAINRGRAGGDLNGSQRTESSRGTRKDRRNRNRDTDREQPREQRGGEAAGGKRHEMAGDDRHKMERNVKILKAPIVPAAVAVVGSTNEKDAQLGGGTADTAKPLGDGTRKYSESRRERRAARSEAKQTQSHGSHGSGGGGGAVNKRKSSENAAQSSGNHQRTTDGGNVMRRASVDSGSGGDYQSKLDRIRNKVIVSENFHFQNCTLIAKPK